MAGQRCCCGCCSVRTGTKIIAVIYIIYSSFSIIVDMINVITVSSYWASQHSRSIHYRRPTTYDYDRSWMYGFVVGLVVGIAQLVLSSLLCAGAYQNDRRKCLPWLWYNTVVTVLSVTLLTMVGVYIAAAADLLIGFIFLIILTIVAAISIYLLNVVNRYIQDLQEGKDTRPCA